MKDKDKPGENDRYLQWNEYQYIDLMSGDELIDFTLESDATADDSASNLTNIWKKCTNANYILADATEKASLPTISVRGEDGTKIEWQARSLLSLNMGPSYGQTLTSADDRYSETLAAKLKDGTYIKNTDEHETKQYLEKVTVKSNYLVSKTSDEIDTTYKLYDESGELTEEPLDFMLKVYEDAPIEYPDDEEVELNTMSDYYTSIPFNKTKAESGEPYTEFYCAMKDSESSYCLIMMYYMTTATSKTDYVSIKLNGSTDGVTPKIFNNYVNGIES